MEADEKANVDYAKTTPFARAKYYAKKRQQRARERARTNAKALEVSANILALEAGEPSQDSPDSSDKDVEPWEGIDGG